MPLILVGAVFLGLFRDHLQHFHTQKLKIITRENICRCEVEEALTFVQRKQLLRAQQELLDLDSCTPPYHPATGYVYRTREGRANNGNMDDEVQQVVGQGGKNQGTIEANKQKMAAAIEANKKKLSYFLFKKELQSSHQRASDGMFYRHSFGAIDVWNSGDCSTRKTSSSSSLSSSCSEEKTKLSYYLVWKSGHEYLRSLLLRFSDPQYLAGGSSASSFIDRTEASCRLGYCAEYLSKDLEGITFPTDQRRFAFTFTRNPLSRFISAYTEIEYRFNGKYNQELPLHFPAGSIERVKEFIIFLLSGGGSKKFLQEFDGDIYHIMPAIGTLLMANRKETRPIHLYRLESFEQEITRLAQESGFIDLVDLYQQAPFSKSHASVSYGNLTSEAARDLLFPRELQNKDHLKSVGMGSRWNSSSSISDDRFLKTICRIYYPDFLCFGYEFPSSDICNNVHTEARNAIERATLTFSTQMKAIISTYMKSEKNLSGLICPPSIKSDSHDYFDASNELDISHQVRESLLNIIQTEMFRLSTDDMLVECDLCDNFPKEYTNRWQEMLRENGHGTVSKDMDFYNHHFGIASVEKRSKAMDTDTSSLSETDISNVIEAKNQRDVNDLPTSLVYYRIWKNANDNIRRLLFHYSSLSNLDQTNPSPCNVVHAEDDIIPDNSCISNMNIQYPSKNGILKRWILSASRRGVEKRFPFTFMRNPIDRFISGYTEIEYRLYRKLMKNGNNWLPLYSKVGTIERVKEFIRYIVAANGSRKILREGNMAHIAPQIGTLIMANNLEDSALNIYRLEDFHKEWQRLAKDSGFESSLLSAYKPQFQGHHRSSFDPYNTTYISRLFFHEYLTQKDANNSSERRPAEVYLRAICRLYLMDFVCGKYELPPVCTHLFDEMDEDLKDFNSDRKEKKTLIGFIRTVFSRDIVPISILRAIASVVCYFHKAPSCNAWVVHGYSGDDED